MKRCLRVLTVTVVALVALGVAIPAYAASPSATSLVTATRYISPGVDVPVFGIDLIAHSCPSLSQVLVDVTQVTGGGTFDIDDLEADTNGPNSGGIELWRDSGTTPDAFDSGDAKVPTSFTWAAAGNGFRATLAVTPAETLPATEQGDYTFFLTIRASSLISNNDDFTVTLPADAFTTEDEIGCLLSPTPDITPVTTAAIIADKTPPAVILFTPPSTPSGNLSWKISESVSGVTQDSAALLRHDTQTEEPVVVSYDSASNTIIVDPVNVLVAGQQYDAVLLPVGASPIVDRAGNPLPSNTNMFRAATTVTETAEGTTYFWRSFTNSAVYGGRYVSNNMAGATISYRFTGTSVTWYTLTDRYQGTAAVSIDGRGFGTFNNYSATAKFKVARTFSGLSSGSHRLTIRVTGSKGSSSGGDVRVAVDAFKAGGVVDANPVVGASWAPVSAAGANGGTYRAARLQNIEMTFTFSGTSIAWRTVRGPAMGQAYVYIDGILKGRFDNYRGTNSYNYLRAFVNLPAGVHTIKIKVAGTKYKSATNTIVAVDGFVIG